MGDVPNRALVIIAIPKELIKSYIIKSTYRLDRYLFIRTLFMYGNGKTVSRTAGTGLIRLFTKGR